MCASQSARNFSIPISVSEWLNNLSSTSNGIVAMSAPIFADSITWIGCLTDATITSVSIPYAPNICMISEINKSPSWPISSSLPTNGETYVAPAFAASNAWFAEKINVTFVLIPSFESYNFV